MMVANMRKRAGMSQRELGAMLGKTQQGVASWESGRAEPSITMLKKMARIFGCTVDELIRDEPEEKTERTG